MKSNLYFLLLSLFLLVINAEEEITKITIKTRKEEIPIEETDEVEKVEVKNNTGTEPQEEVPLVHKRDNAESESEKMINEAKKNVRQNTTEKFLILNLPYQDNDDYLIAPLGLGTPVNFVPVQVETTSYKSWVSSILNEANPSTFSYNMKDSSTAEEIGEWDTVEDECGAISGNVLLDTAYIGKYKIDKFKFMEGVEYEDEFNDFKNGKLGLGNCHYAPQEEKQYCLIQRLKDNGSIDRRIFSIRELSETHGELIIGDIPEKIKNREYPLLNVINEEAYSDIDDNFFKMGWLTKVSHVLFRNSTENIKKIFDNNIHIENGLASFDSSSHYIEAPYAFMSEFEDKMFDIYYDNVCRKVNRDGTYLFLCEKERYDEIKDKNKNLSFIIVMDGYGYEIPMNFLFEQINDEDYEFFVHFRNFEQNIWNLGHPFFHHYTIVFDQDNQEIGIDGDIIYSLQDETEAELKKRKSGGWFKFILIVLLIVLLIGGLFMILRYRDHVNKSKNGVPDNLLDNESDFDFNPGTQIQS